MKLLSGYQVSIEDTCSDCGKGADSYVLFIEFEIDTDKIAAVFLLCKSCLKKALTMIEED